MWKKAYEENDITLSIELTSYCNARCPQCSRTDQDNNLKPHTHFPMVHWSYEDFVRRVGDDITHLRSVNFCGTHGDAGMNPELFEICKWIIDNSNARINMHTNMAMRTPQFWEKLAEYCGKRLAITCAIDGITDEMHQTYRRGCPLNKVIANFKAAKAARRRTFTIFFKHNWEAKDEILTFCEMLGSEEIGWIESNRFHYSDEFPFIDEDGNPQALEAVPREWKDSDFETNLIASSRIRSNKEILAERLKQETNVTCRKEKINNIYVNLEGNIFPCCYLGGSKALKRLMDKPVWNEYLDSDFSLDRTSIRDFIYSTWVDNLETSLREDPMTVCKAKCGDYKNNLVEDN